MKPLPFFFFFFFICFQYTKAQFDYNGIANDEFKFGQQHQSNVYLEMKSDFLGFQKSQIKDIRKQTKNKHKSGYFSDSAYNFKWDDITPGWIITAKEITDYNDIGFLNFYVYTFDANTSIWNKRSKRTHSYDSNGNLTEILFSFWDETNANWLLNHKEIFIYDSQGNLTENIFQIWDKNSSFWENVYKGTYIYDSNGYNSESVTSEWNSTTSNWFNLSKYIPAYDNYGNITTEISLNWNIDNSTWTNFLQVSYTYDQNNYCTGFINEDWDYNSSSWIINSKGAYINNSEGNHLEYLLQSWNNQSTTWINSFTYYASFDANGNQTEFISKNWDLNSSKWVNLQRSLCYFSQHDLALVAQIGEIDKLKLYPNPSTDIIFLEDIEPNSSVQIFDINGKMAKNLKIEGNKIDISTFQKGIYFLKFNSKNQVITKKIVKL